MPLTQAEINAIGSDYSSVRRTVGDTILLKDTGNGPALHARAGGVWGEFQQSAAADVRAFGAVGDGVTDDTTAIQDAIDAAKADGGGVVVLPAGKTFVFSTTLDLSDARNVTLDGGAGRSGAAALSSLLYTGTASPAITIASSQGVNLHDLNITYNNPSFTGTLVEAGHSASASDTVHATIQRCRLSGVPGTATDAASLLELGLSHSITVRDTAFARAVRAITSVEGYSNVITINRCYFRGTEFAPIHETGQTWAIINNTFEPLADGTAGALSTDGVDFSRGLTYIGNWHGDVNTGGNNWLELKILGATISGNYFGTAMGTGAAIELVDGVQGVSVSGNRFDTFYGISVPAPTVRGMIATGNDFQGDTFVNGLANITAATLASNTNSDTQISGPTIGFFGATPVVQPSLPAAGTVTADDIRQALIDLGLCS